MLEIRVPKDSKVLYIGNNGSFESEAELLISRNTNYKVLDIQDSKLILEVIN